MPDDPQTRSDKIKNFEKSKDTKSKIHSVVGDAVWKEWKGEALKMTKKDMDNWQKEYFDDPNSMLKETKKDKQGTAPVRFYGDHILIATTADTPLATQRSNIEAIVKTLRTIKHELTQKVKVASEGLNQAVIEAITLQFGKPKKIEKVKEWLESFEHFIYLQKFPEIKRPCIELLAALIRLDSVGKLLDQWQKRLKDITAMIDAKKGEKGGGEGHAASSTQPQAPQKPSPTKKKTG